MDNLKRHGLDGEDNKRIDKTDVLENERTAPWAEVNQTLPETNVSIPGLEAVLQAKNWVDNGSRL